MKFLLQNPIALEVIEKLRTIGLGAYESKFYAGLRVRGELSAHKISAFTLVPVQKIYITGLSLAEKKLIEIRELRPRMFYPKPFDYFLLNKEESGKIPLKNANELMAMDKNAAVLYLKEFGLTDTEALTYVMLLSNGPTTNTQMSRRLQISRPYQHRVFAGMMESNLVTSHKMVSERTGSSGIHYSAVPYDDIIKKFETGRIVALDATKNICSEIDRLIEQMKDQQ